VNGFFIVGKIESVYRDTNYVKIRSYTDNPDRFKAGNTVQVDFYGNIKPLTIFDAQQDGAFASVRFVNFDTSDDCEFLIGKFLYIPEEDAISLPEFSYFIHDLIGSTVEAEDGVLGTIKDVLSYPANDVYVVEDSDGNEILIPALKELIASFSPSGKVMRLKAGKSYFNDKD
jgi:16S rRNA processing protein RimM